MELKALTLPCPLNVAIPTDDHLHPHFHLTPLDLWLKHSFTPPFLDFLLRDSVTSLSTLCLGNYQPLPELAAIVPHLTSLRHLILAPDSTSLDAATYAPVLSHFHTLTSLTLELPASTLLGSLGALASVLQTLRHLVVVCRRRDTTPSLLRALLPLLPLLPHGIKGDRCPNLIHVTVPTLSERLLETWDVRDIARECLDRGVLLLGRGGAWVPE